MKLSFISCVALLTLPSLAHAHGTVIQLQIVDNKIITKGLVSPTTPNGGEAAPTSPQRLYSLNLVATVPTTQLTNATPNANGWYIGIDNTPYLGPGFGYGSVGTAAFTASTLSANLTAGLQYWNGSSFVPTPDGTQLQGSRTGSITGLVAAATVRATSIEGGTSSIPYAITTVTPTSHAQTYWRLTNNGVTNYTPADGFYLATFTVSTDQPNIAPSAPYYFLLSKNAGDASAPTAFLNANIIPEPTALGLLLPTAALLSRRRK